MPQSLEGKAQTEFVSKLHFLALLQEASTVRSLILISASLRVTSEWNRQLLVPHMPVLLKDYVLFQLCNFLVYQDIYVSTSYPVLKNESL